MKTMTPAEILNLPMESNDANAKTVREYLVKLLLTVWKEGEGFSGKRAFGNSGWHFELYEPIATAGLVKASFDEDGWLEDIDTRKADKLIEQAIKALGEGKP